MCGPSAAKMFRHGRSAPSPQPHTSPWPRGRLAPTTSPGVRPCCPVPWGGLDVRFNLLAALALGWICIAARAMTLGNRTFSRTLAIAGAPLAVLLLSAAVYESWVGSMIGAPKETHDVVAVQGGLPPFAGGFATTSERLLTPVILYSSLHPDLVIFPECIVQAGGAWTSPINNPPPSVTTPQPGWASPPPTAGCWRSRLDHQPDLLHRPDRREARGHLEGPRISHPDGRRLA